MTVLFAAGEGVVQGGWEYVWASYGLTWLFLAGYTASLIARGRSAPTPEAPPGGSR